MEMQNEDNKLIAHLEHMKRLAGCCCSKITLLLHKKARCALLNARKTAVLEHALDSEHMFYQVAVFDG